MDKTSILLLSNLALFRDGLKSLLADTPGLEVIGECEPGPLAIEWAQRCRPNVVILEISKDDQESFQLVRDLRQAAKTGVIVVSPLHDPASVLALLRAGVNGYLSNQEARAELVRAVDSVARGEVYLCPSASHVLLLEYRGQKRCVSSGHSPS